MNRDLVIAELAAAIYWTENRTVILAVYEIAHKLGIDAEVIRALSELRFGGAYGAPSPGIPYEPYREGTRTMALDRVHDKIDRDRTVRG